MLNTFGLFNEFFPPHVYLTPRKVIDNIGGWNEELSNNDDAEFFTRVVLNAEEIRFTPEAHVYYRYGNENKLSTLNSPERIESLIKSWQLVENFILEKNIRASLSYVRRAKQNLYDYLLKDSPSLLKEYEDFFKSRKNFDSYGMNVYKRIKGIFK